MICHFCKIAKLQFYLFLESSYLTIVFLSCNRFINFTFINTPAACLPKWLTVKLRMLRRSLNQSWQHFGFENIIDKNGIRTLDKSKTVCKECRAQISYGTGNTTNMFTHRQRKHPHLYEESNMPTKQNHPRCQVQSKVLPHQEDSRQSRVLFRQNWIQIAPEP